MNKLQSFDVKLEAHRKCMLITSIHCRLCVEHVSIIIIAKIFQFNFKFMIDMHRGDSQGWTIRFNFDLLFS